MQLLFQGSSSFHNFTLLHLCANVFVLIVHLRRNLMFMEKFFLIPVPSKIMSKTIFGCPLNVWHL